MPRDWAAFHAARAEENQNRALAYLSLAPSLCGCPVVPFTARHRIELELSGNAFFTNLAPLKGDVLEFLWRLHFAFRRPTGETPNVPAGAPRPTSLVSWFRRRRIRRHLRAKAFDLAAAARAIKARLAVSYQDQAASVEDGKGLSSPLTQRAHWLDSFTAYFCLECGWSLEAVLDAPLALLFQLYRAQCLARGIEKPFIAPSDSLVPAANDPEAAATCGERPKGVEP